MRLAVIRVFIIGELIAATAFGQSASINGQIGGTVTDPSGAPVAVARIEAVNAGTGYRQAVTTSSLTTMNFVRSMRPKLVVSATSAASRPVAIRMRPMRGWLWRASKVNHRPDR